MFEPAWSRIQASVRPSTDKAQELHFRTFLSYMLCMDLPACLSLHNIMVFLEYLYQPSLSTKVIKNYHSSLMSKTRQFGLEHTSLFHPAFPNFVEVSASIHTLDPLLGGFLTSPLYTGSLLPASSSQTPFYFEQFF